MKFEMSFVSSFSSLEALPKDGRPEIAIIGRSNVGKSSLINALADRKQLAKTSSTPGKTRTLNYYAVNDSWYLIDMPGYGYAKQAKTERAAWARLTERYFTERKELRAVGLLIDSRHSGIESDVQALEWFREEEIPTFAVLTKCDKSTQADIATHVRSMERSAASSNTSSIEEIKSVLPIFRTSSVKGSGIGGLREFIEKIASERNSD